jgi:glycosyltransferase involved in cell wall biosynthesis
LIEAMPAIVAARPDVHVLVIGDGPLRDRLRDLARKLGVAERLHLAGFRTDIPSCLAAMDLFALTSIYEGLPISILEAMATGLPVIATDVDGVPEAVTDGVTGTLIAPGKPQRLAQEVLGLLAEPARAAEMGAAGREQVRLRFTIDRFVASVRGEYEVALGARHPEKENGQEEGQHRSLKAL